MSKLDLSNIESIKGLSVYEEVRSVPVEAKKSIQAGRLKGMTDINPMWRIKTLTEVFGPIGLGWYYEITSQWIEEGSEFQKVAFTNINLFVKYGNEWSKPIQGTGGSSFIAKESKGLYTSDECFKMALTDAISVACKAIGIGADVYWEKDKSKYDKQGEPAETKKDSYSDKPKLISEGQRKRLYAIGKGKDVQVKNIMSKYGYSSSNDIQVKDYEKICKEVEGLK